MNILHDDTLAPAQIFAMPRRFQPRGPLRPTLAIHENIVLHEPFRKAVRRLDIFPRLPREPLGQIRGKDMFAGLQIDARSAVAGNRVIKFQLLHCLRQHAKHAPRAGAELDSLRLKRLHRRAIALAYREMIILQKRSVEIRYK